MVVASQPSVPEWRAALDAWLQHDIKLTSSLTIKPIQFKLEAAVFAVAVIFVLLHAIGKRKNQRLANTWVKEALPVIEKEFATTAKDGEGKGQLLLWNGGDEAVLYASGRRSVESLHAHFNLTPRHDPLQNIYHFLYDIAVASTISSVRDTLTLSFVLPPTSDNTSGVFAIIDKSVLQSLRSVRPFDLSFARLLDTNDQREARGLDRKWAIMSENAELTDQFLGSVGPAGDERRNKIGIQTVLNSSAGNWLESLILTDLPQDRPEGTFTATSHPRLLIVNLRVPPTPATSQLSLPLLTLSTNILDALEFSYIKLSDKCMSKVRKARTDFEKEVEKERERERKEEEEEERLKKKAAEEKIKREGLSEKELAKRKELEEKRARRKQQGKQRIRA